MKSTVSATHLLRAFLLFTLVVLFLLTMMRAGLSLWQFHVFESADDFINLFLTGLRFDVALVACVLFIPITLGTFIAMIPPLRAVARYLILFILLVGLIVILLAEYITPYFIAINGLRPDIPTITGIANPVLVIANLWSDQLIPAVVGLVLLILIIIAFVRRLEMDRFLRFPVSILSGLALIIFGGAICALAIVSNVDFIRENPQIPVPLHPSAAVQSINALANELSLNTAYKMGWSLVPPADNAY